MRELALVLPEDVWITEANASASASAENGAAPAAAGQGAAGPNVNLVGCAPSQPAVAEVLVRLRNLHRADDVQLAESAAPGAGEGESVTTGCGGGDRVQFNLTVTFSAPPALEAQGERGEAVPTELGGGA